jgi:hypothetical protein
MNDIPITLTLAPVPDPQIADLSLRRVADMAAAPPAHLAVPSQRDVLALLRAALEKMADAPFPLQRVERAAAGGEHPLDGVTAVIFPADVPAALSILGPASSGRRQQELVSALIGVGRERDLLASRRPLTNALNDGRPPDPDNPDPLLEAAALFPLLQRTAATAAAEGQGVVLQYGMGAPPRLRRAGGWLGAQTRPLLVALLFALHFLLFAWIDGGLWPRLGGQLLRPWDPALTLLLAGLGFLVPLWTGQAGLWLLGRQRGDRPRLGAAGNGAGREERPFYLRLPFTDLRFTLGVLSGAALPSPAPIFAAVAALSLLGLFAASFASPFAYTIQFLAPAALTAILLWFSHRGNSG